MARSRAGFLLASSPAARSLSRYSCALTNCSRTSDADLARVPGNGPPAADRVGAVGHLQAAGDASIRQRDEEVVDGAALPQLQVERLAAQQVARAGHDVGRRDAAGLRALDAGGPDVDRVEHAHIGLNRRRAVAAGGAGDVAVRIDQARHDRLAGQSCVSAPAGTGTAAPTATILPSRTTSVPFSMTGPLIGMMRALVNACVDWASSRAGDRARDRASAKMNDFSM